MTGLEELEVDHFLRTKSGMVINRCQCQVKIDIFYDIENCSAVVF